MSEHNPTPSEYLEASTFSHPDAAKAARVLALAGWAKTEDRTARTAPARAAMARQFLDQVDLDRALDPEERGRRALEARRAHYAEMGRASARARAVKRGDAA